MRGLGKSGCAGLLLGLAFALMPGRAHAANTCAPPIDGGAYACTIDPAIDPLALCNDGTLPAFWVRPGSGSGATKWLIWMQGGGDCVDMPSCVVRGMRTGAQHFLTSNGFQPETGGGILSFDPHGNPMLYNYNTVELHYCSSDKWSGDYASGMKFHPDYPTTWNFEGRRIALAQVQALRELGLGFENATQILIGGTSGGGIGVTMVANDVLPTLPPAPDKRVINDAGFSIDIGQYDPYVGYPYIYTGEPNAFYAHFQAGIALWHGHGDSKCYAAATSLDDQIQCYNASYVLQNNLIDVPVFVAESQIDTSQMVAEICPQKYGRCRVPTNPMNREGIYAVNFGKTMAADLVGAGTKAAYTVASPDIYVHVILQDPVIWQSQFAIPGGTTTARDQFNAWLATDGTSRVVTLGNGPGVGPPP